MLKILIFVQAILLIFQQILGGLQSNFSELVLPINSYKNGMTQEFFSDIQQPLEFSQEKIKEVICKWPKGNRTICQNLIFLGRINLSMCETQKQKKSNICRQEVQNCPTRKDQTNLLLLFYSISLFFNFSCRFLTPNYFFQFEF